jgi:hypothetical protein
MKPTTGLTSPPLLGLLALITSLEPFISKVLKSWPLEIGENRDIGNIRNRK